MMPALLPAISVSVSPRYSVWSMPIGVITAIFGVGDVGRVPGAAEPDLDDRDVHRDVGERGIGHGGEDLELGQRQAVRPGPTPRRPGRCTARCRCRTRTYRSAEIGAPSMAIRSVTRLQVRRGEPAGPQPGPVQQRIDHPGGGGLAVGAGDLDDRVGRLRVAQQVEQRGDPVQRRRDLHLGAPPVQQRLDHGQASAAARPAPRGRPGRHVLVQIRGRRGDLAGRVGLVGAGRRPPGRRDCRHPRRCVDRRPRRRGRPGSAGSPVTSAVPRSVASRSVSRATSAAALAARSRIFSTTASGRLGQELRLAQPLGRCPRPPSRRRRDPSRRGRSRRRRRSCDEVSSSTVTVPAPASATWIEAVAVKRPSAGSSRASAAAVVSSSAPRRRCRRRPTGQCRPARARLGGTPWSARNRRISVTSRSMSATQPAAAASFDPAGRRRPVGDHQALPAGQRRSTGSR